MALGLYIHVPFCPQRCPYCAFATVVGQEDRHGLYAEAICREIESWGHLSGPVETVFLGGGTPSQVEPALIGQMLEAAQRHLGLHSDAEISVEVNPGTVDREKFAALKALGCNRISIGAQAFRDADLRHLGRQHSAADVERAYAAARAAGFANVSLDLVANVLGVSEANWHFSVERAIALTPEHLSVYSLTIEEGTIFAQRQRQGLLEPVVDDRQARTLEWTDAQLVAAGYEHYEISNYARLGYRSRHNWGYWTGVPYLGVGLGAHSFIDGKRFWNTRDFNAYLDAMHQGRSPCAGEETIAPDTARRERLWLGLRTIEGVELTEEEVGRMQGSKRFDDLEKVGYLVLESQRLRLTRAGFLLADALSLELDRIVEEG
ncbi:MAG: radical SAM family heme chaperone HemW [Gemmatimonadetes bacterium]|nr:radical SAM family heme chaperone HemW [Gemmatimonadota bacterium]MXY83207.1 radical SAM family heme chaperone HemW [Gemmatimonadota bacterium]MYB70594.1 radical SAM family heme chaperone HemW [Gemmatimonadota bacterium]